MRLIALKTSVIVKTPGIGTKLLSKLSFITFSSQFGETINLTPSFESFLTCSLSVTVPAPR